MRRAELVVRFPMSQVIFYAIKIFVFENEQKVGR